MKSRVAYVFGLMLALCAVGLLFVGSASSWISLRDYGDAFHLLKRQALFFAAGLLSFFIALCTPTTFLRRKAVWIFAFSCLAMFLLFTPLAVESGGSKRWLTFLGGILQPSEFLKIGSVIFLSAVLHTLLERKVQPVIWLFALLISCLPVCLVALEPDLGSTAVIVFVFFTLFFLAGTAPRYLIAGVGVFGGTLTVLALLFPYARNRILSFMNPYLDPAGTGYNQIQSLLAFGTGGLWGVGLGMSRQKFQWLPQAHNDFIFAIIAEEIGLLGVVVLIVLFLALSLVGYGLAFRARSMFVRLLTGGLTSLIVFQAIIHIAVSTSSLPITGITLPFISYGGSSLVASMTACGILARIAREEVATK